MKSEKFINFSSIFFSLEKEVKWERWKNAIVSAWPHNTEELKRNVCIGMEKAEAKEKNNAYC